MMMMMMMMKGLCPVVAYRGIVLGDSDQTYHIHVISIGGGLCNYVLRRIPPTADPVLLNRTPA